ncbi:hypothetical protein CYG49_04450 [Candidatus Saccharibacteria bacterium]|nr:MAG: hypothetical protein CYG49_04450 [Candidatus Saccharibacteria bacterium]
MNSKLMAVIRHEYLTIVKQPTFWIIMLLLPALMAVVIAITVFSAKLSEEKIQESAKSVTNVAIIDESGLIRPDAIAKAGLASTDPAQKEATIQKVKDGALDGAIVYPKDLLKNRRFDVHVKTDDATKTTVISEVGRNVLRTSVFAPLGSEEIILLAQEGAGSNVITYGSGQEKKELASLVVPGLFVVLFYVVLTFSVNYMLTSVAEEKENRSMEMVLTYIQPRTLMFGKLLGITLVTLTQIAFIVTLALIAFLIFKQLSGQVQIPLPINFNEIVFDPQTIFFGLGFLIAGFVLFAALMAGIGAMVPSAKDAGGLSFIIIIGAIIPFYTGAVISTDPTSPITKFMTFFPTTAPVTLLIRNTAGNLALWEAILGLVLLVVYAFLAVLLAGKLFRLGALEYNNRVSFMSIFK